MNNDKFIFPTFMRAGGAELSKGGLTKREYIALQLLLAKSNFSSALMDEAIHQADDFLLKLKAKSNYE